MSKWLSEFKRCNGCLYDFVPIEEEKCPSCTFNWRLTPTQQKRFEKERLERLEILERKKTYNQKYIEQEEQREQEREDAMFSNPEIPICEFTLKSRGTISMLSVNDENVIRMQHNLNNLPNGCIIGLVLNLQHNLDNLHEKFDKFIDMVEFAPGGEHFQQAEQRFKENAK